MHILVGLAFAVLAFSTPAHAAPVSCHHYTNTSAPLTGFGVPYDVLSIGREMLVTATCDTATNQARLSIGRGSTAQYIYEQGYRYDGNQWIPFTYQGANKNGQWLLGSGTHSLTLSAAQLAQTHFVVGYVCTWNGSEWKCGCRDSACTTPSWQLQAFTFPTTSGGGSSTSGGGSSSGSGSLTGKLSGLPNYFALGAKGNEDFAFNWMKENKDAMDYRYAYIAAGVNTGNTWQNWSSPRGQYVVDFMNSSRSNGFIPIFTYYQIVQSRPNVLAEPPLGNLRNNGTMRAYFDDWKFLMQKIGAFGDPVIVHVEPDMWGHLQNAGSNPNNVQVSVRSSGHSDVGQFDNNASGLAKAFIHIRDNYAPNAILAYSSTHWVSADLIVQNTNGTTQGNAVGDFYNALDADFDLMFHEYSDRDGEFYRIVRGNSEKWWNPDDFERKFDFIEAIYKKTGLRGMLWQIPIGNRFYLSMNNTEGHYQDNKVEHLLGDGSRANIERYVQYGVIGALFGDGEGRQTHFADRRNDGVTNPGSISSRGGGRTSERATHADDDGGYLRKSAQEYYRQGPVPLQ